MRHVQNDIPPDVGNADFHRNRIAEQSFKTAYAVAIAYARVAENIPTADFWSELTDLAGRKKEDCDYCSPPTAPNDTSAFIALSCVGAAAKMTSILIVYDGP